MKTKRFCVCLTFSVMPVFLSEVVLSGIPVVVEKAVSFLRGPNTSQSTVLDQRSSNRAQWDAQGGAKLVPWDPPSSGVKKELHTRNCENHPTSLPALFQGPEAGNGLYA